MIRWWLPPKQREVKKKRKPYKRGAKAYLSSFEIGEERVIKDEYSWNGIRVVASIMKRDYGCHFVFRNKNTITRIA